MPRSFNARRALALVSLVGAALATTATSPIITEVDSSSPPPPAVVLSEQQTEVRMRAHLRLSLAEVSDVVSGQVQLVLLAPPGGGDPPDGGAAQQDAGTGAQVQGQLEVFMQRPGAAEQVDAGQAADAGDAGEQQPTGRTLPMVVDYPLDGLQLSPVLVVLDSCRRATLCEEELTVVFRASNLAPGALLNVGWDLQATARIGREPAQGDTLTISYARE